MKILPHIAILAILLVGCTNPLTKEQKAEKVFKEYVKTDFDDPSSLKEIISVECIDTMWNYKLLSSAKLLNEVLEEFPNVKAMNDVFIEKLEADTTFIIAYKIKARIETSDGLKLREYHVNEDRVGNMHVTKFKRYDRDYPDVYLQALAFLESFVKK